MTPVRLQYYSQGGHGFCKTDSKVVDRESPAKTIFHLGIIDTQQDEGPRSSIGGGSILSDDWGSKSATSNCWKDISIYFNREQPIPLKFDIDTVPQILAYF